MVAVWLALFIGTVYGVFLGVMFHGSFTTQKDDRPTIECEIRNG